MILAVAHDEFKKLSLADISALFKGGKGILADVKGILDKNEFENAGFTYWRL